MNEYLLALLMASGIMAATGLVRRRLRKAARLSVRRYRLY